MIHVRTAFLFVASLLLASACNQGQTPNLAVITVNSQIGPESIIVTTTPVSLLVRTNRTGPGSVEIFDGEKSLGKVAFGVKRTDVENSYDFGLSVPVSASDNGVHTYKAIFFGKDSTGAAVQFTTPPTVATVQVK